MRDTRICLFVSIHSFLCFRGLAGSQFADCIVCLINFQYCRSHLTYILTSTAECWIFDFINITCFFRQISCAFFLDLCFQCLLYIVFTCICLSFIICQNFWTYHLRRTKKRVTSKLSPLPFTWLIQLGLARPKLEVCSRRRIKICTLQVQISSSNLQVILLLKHVCKFQETF